ncbi:MAG: peptidase U32 family protein [Planctomycetota bacterium]
MDARKVNLKKPETRSPRSPEILAPAGGPAALKAALAAGAHAVYFGLLEMNARRGAENFPPGRLAETVREVHAGGARAHLALNTDLAERELGAAARALALARASGVDAVLVRDAAFLALRPFFPEMEFHWSTQAGVSNSRASAAAGRLGIDRVILARELSLEEVRAASLVPGVATEAFVQGALCFCVSGRCLLSSWVGGRSGNRGTCTSPCRVQWSLSDGREGRLLSMHDLALLECLGALRAAGVSAFKIEGRLKTADWVGRAVSLYRRVLDGEDPAALRNEALSLGDYTGRALTSGYLDGVRSGLVNASGRPATDGAPDEAHPARKPSAREEEGYVFSIKRCEGALHCRCTARGRREEWTVTASAVRRPDKAASLSALGARLSEAGLQGMRLKRFETDAPELLLPRKNVNALFDRLSAALHRSKKGPDPTIRIELPEPVRAAIAPGNPSPKNNRVLGERPDRARLAARDAQGFLRRAQVEGAIVEQASPSQATRFVERFGPERLLFALPPVFYESEVPAVEALVRACDEAGAAIEVNSWCGWELARTAGTRLEAGPGLAVLNSLAASVLYELGMECVTVSLEADRKQLEALLSALGVPASIVVYGRPALMVTRAEIPWSAGGGVFLEDTRGVRLQVLREGALTVFRPEEPFDLTDIRNEGIRACHLVADLVSSPDPLSEWRLLGEPGRNKRRFNYHRTLY